jgi:uncharacterized RDD family membrane protein YckC
VFGNTEVTGPVGDSVVSVFGNGYVDSVVKGDVVAVFGNLGLGPRAEIGGNLVSIGGTVQRDPAAKVAGGVQIVLPGMAERVNGLKPWIRNCLLLARPLAFVPGIAWAWGLALGFLVFYVLLALLAGPAVERCAETLESRPGRTLLISVLAVLLVPMLMVILAITVIGLVLIPFLSLGLMAATLFGKAVMLAWLGRLVLRGAGRGEPWRVALAVLVGGAITLLLYCVPVVGFIVFKLLGVLGLGVVIHTLALAWNVRRAGNGVPAAGASAPAPMAAAADGAASAAAAPAPEPEPVATAAVIVSLPRAGFWLRMLALFIDIILIGILAGAIGHAGGSFFLLVLVAYGAVMWKLRGTTVGGIICNLQVVRVDGRPLDWSTCIVRGLSCLLSMAIAGLGFFWIAFDAEKQAWHDKIAGTVVVRNAGTRGLV